MSPPPTPQNDTPAKPERPDEQDRETTQPERFAAAEIPLAPDGTTHPSIKNN
jgi:hypothetical protein